MFRTLDLSIIHLDRVDSTNNYAATLISEGKARNGTVILADEQYSGRGQRGSDWLSWPYLNLTFSLVVLPDNLSANDQFILSKLVAVSLVDLLRKFNIHAKIKWPNDILVNKRKIAGVLIENTISHGKIESSVIGIGININQIAFKGLSAISMCELCGKPIELKEVLFLFLDTFNEILIKFANGSIDLGTEYLNNLYGFREFIQLNDKHGDFIGTVHSLEDNGRLVVASGGSNKSYDLKELKFIFQNNSSDSQTSG